MTPSGIEQATFRFVPQHLNHCATAVPHNATGSPIINGHPQFNRHRQHSFSGNIACQVHNVTSKALLHILRVTVVKIFAEYEERLRTMPYVPRFLYRCRMLQDGGGPNRFFLTYLFCHQAMATEFLKGIDLLRSKMKCNTCGRDMTWSADSNLPEGFRWRCQRRVAGVSCNKSASIKQGLWFQQSNLTPRNSTLHVHRVPRTSPPNPKGILHSDHLQVRVLSYFFF